MRHLGLVAYGLLGSALALSAAVVGCGGAEGSPAVAQPVGDAGLDGDADADSGPGCKWSVSFAAPADGAQLTAQNDKDGDFCANGFQYDVVVATSAPDGTGATLYANGSEIGNTAVSSGVARFSDVQMNAKGTTALRVTIGAECEEQASVGVDCGDVPTCEISKPVLSDTHPELNGVPVSEGGDRVSAPGSAYQVAFEVTTSVEDGQPVILRVDGNGAAVSANASGGKATFAGVTLQPDGDHAVSARCVPKVGIEGTSAEVTYTVDTQAPPLAARKQKLAGLSELAAGDHFNPEDDADSVKDGLQIRVCGVTDKATAPDALDLPASLGAGQQNFCVGVGANSPTCVAATTGGASSAGDGACVNLDCPGGGPFDLTLTLRDDAGNPTEQVVQAVTCASTLPQVQFVDPVGDAPPYSDITKRILANSMPDPQRKDKDPIAPGAQYDVTACTSVTAGTARLLGGLDGTALDEISTVNVVPDTGNLCGSTGLSGVAQFTDVTIPESFENTDLTLKTATALQVEVTDSELGVGSATANLWVDSSDPALSVGSPAGLCGKIYDTGTPVTTDVLFLTSVVPVQMTVNGTSYQGNTVTTGVVEIESVVFPLGINQVAASVTEPAGNIGRIPSPCTVTVGNVPTVTWVTPTSGSLLAASTTSGAQVIPDANNGVAGWQGTLKVCTNIDKAANPTATVQFSTNLAGNLGAPVLLDASGCAERPNTDLPEADAVVITATTSVVNAYSGTASITVPVDVVAPAAPSGISASVKDRRQTTFAMAWTAPADGTKAAAGYEVRVSNAAIDSEAKFAAAQKVDYTGVPAAAGSPDGIDVADKLIENDYYFAIAAKDLVGNRGGFVATPAPTRAAFKSVTLTGNAADERFGYWIDGSADVNGDNQSDVLVGAFNGTTAYLYFGSTTGLPTQPSVQFTGGTIGFGTSVAVVGDVNQDGRPDIAIGSPAEADGKVYLYYGRATWPAVLNATQADVQIVASSAGDSKFASSYFGFSLSRVGDFNADGVDDFAVGAPVYGGAQGQVTVVYGLAGGFGPTLTVPAAFGTRAQGFVGTAAAFGVFGWLTHAPVGFYGTNPSISSLIVSAPTESANSGRVFAFSGRPPSATPVLSSEANQTFAGEAASYLGYSSLASLRAISGLSKPAIVMATPALGPAGRVRVFSGTESTGPFAQVLADIRDAEATKAYDFGTLVETGAFSGSVVTTSFIGSSAPDLVVSSRATTTLPARIRIIDGEKLPGLGSVPDVGSVTDVNYPLPAGWIDFGGHCTSARDIDGDGYGDIIVPEYAYTPDPFVGRVIVLW